MKVTPLQDRLLVKRVESAGMTKSGLLHIPDSAKEKPAEGIVVAVGAGEVRVARERRQHVVVEADPPGAQALRLDGRATASAAPGAVGAAGAVHPTRLGPHAREARASRRGALGGKQESRKDRKAAAAGKAKAVSRDALATLRILAA